MDMAGTAAMAATGSAMVISVATAFLAMVITTIGHFFAYNSCWKWSPYGPVNVCNRYY